MNEPAGSGATWRRLVADAEHGPLPGLMLVLTVLTGVVDAVSILSLGRVLVANMTGNVVFVGFALAGAERFSLAASLSPWPSCWAGRRWEGSWPAAWSRTAGGS